MGQINTQIQLTHKNVLIVGQDGGLLQDLPFALLAWSHALNATVQLIIAQIVQQEWPYKIINVFGSALQVNISIH